MTLWSTTGATFLQELQPAARAEKRHNQAFAAFSRNQLQEYPSPQSAAPIMIHLIDVLCRKHQTTT